MSTEKKARIQDNLNAIQRNFKPLRAIYTRVNDDCAGMEYTHIEVGDINHFDKLRRSLSYTYIYI